ncbi:hypothetical protein ACHQM5_027299 [Ranunculus cassubicifolius]
MDETGRELALIAKGNDFSILENHDFEIVRGNEIDHSLEFEDDKNQEIDEYCQDIVLHEHNQLVTTPIVQARALDASPDHNLFVGQQFADVASCRRALRNAAIALRFEIKTVKSDKTRFTAKCATEGCPWRIHAAKLPDAPTFSVRTIHGEHTCGGIAHVGHQQASVQWVASTVEQQLMENPQYKPKDILEEIHKVHGITLSYKQAWRGKERVMASLRGSFEEGYRLLPQYCEQIKQSNPGSIASVYTDPNDNCFQRFFISFQASIFGYVNACRPLLGLDTTVLKNKYLGALLLATGFDGDGASFPLAFGIINEENDENWVWFLSELHKLLENNTVNMPRLTILSDRRKGIVDAVESNFPTAFHGYCMRHLSDSFQKDYNNALLVNLLWHAAHAPTGIEFESKMLEIQNISQEASYWIRSIPPYLWATYCFEGTRFGQLTANIVEGLSSFIVEASGFPIVQMIEHIRRQLMTWFNERREVSMSWNSILVPFAEKHVSMALEHAKGCQVLRANEAEFEVISEQGTSIVDIRSRDCSCRGWQLYGLPCAHAAAALSSCRQDAHRFTESFFTVATYRKAYSQTIHPVPDKSLWENETDMVNINPPKALRPQGKPKKRRARSEDYGRVKRVVHCSRCNQPGHFRTTCATPM